MMNSGQIREHKHQGYTRYEKLYLKSAFSYNISNISHQGYFTDKVKDFCSFDLILGSGL